MTAIPNTPIEDLENDLAALQCARDAVALSNECAPVELKNAIFNNGAATFEPDAVVHWLDARIAETERAIDLLLRVPPDPPHVVLALEGGIVQGYWSSGPVSVTVRDYDTEGADDGRIIKSPDGDYATYAINGSVRPDKVKQTEAEVAAHEAREMGVE